MDLKPTKVSEVLLEEFMIPLHISACKLADFINVSVSRIQDILCDREKITADISSKLGRFFGVSESFFLNIQKDIDLINKDK